MREIKFRGYDKRNGWVYGNLLENDRPQEGSIYQILNKTTESRFDVEVDSIGQYTGFKDKNGVEIYEGDIVKYETYDELDTHINKAEVYFDDELGMWMAHEERKKEVNNDIQLHSMNGRVEVIGNIYEKQLPKQEKWIVHRRLRKSNKETYLVDYFCGNDEVIYVKGIAHYFSYDKNKAYNFEDKNTAIQVRDKLNTLRVGKQYLWVISKVEE